MDLNIEKLQQISRHGGIMAYPTEAVFGLGCDPNNSVAIEKLLTLKNRDPRKGLILIAASWSQLQAFVEPLGQELMTPIFASWPGPNTWLLPYKNTICPLLHGKFDSLAVRVTNHPIAKQLCHLLDSPLVSTSANPEGKPPARSLKEIEHYFPQGIDWLISGDLGQQQNPTIIRDGRTGAIIRDT